MLLQDTNSWRKPMNVHIRTDLIGQHNINLHPLTYWEQGFCLTSDQDIKCTPLRK